MLQKLSLKGQVLVAAFALALLVSISGTTIYSNVNQMIESQNWVTHTVEVIQNFKELIEGMIDMETGQRGFLMSGDEKFLEPYNISIKSFDQKLKKLQKKVSDNPTQVKRLDQILVLKNKWLKIAKKTEMKARYDFNKGLISIDQFEEILRRAEGKTVMDLIRKKVSASVKMEHDLNIKRKARNVAVANQTLNWLVYGLSLSLIIGFIFLYFVVSKVMKRITKISHDLSLFSDEVLSASIEMLKSSEVLASGNMEQATALQQTSSSMTEISSMLTKSSQNAEVAKNNSEVSEKSVSKGKEVVSEMVHSIREIEQSNEKISSQLENNNKEMIAIIDVINEIEDNTKIINDIVFQTKLLSFNASVEAARAGESGKGFAVVADEIGNLAQMSGQAAGNIFSMLEKSIKTVEETVENSKTKVSHLIIESNKKIENGVLVANSCRDVFNEIIQNVSEVSHLTSEISSAGHEQKIGIKEISLAMRKMDSITVQNSTLSQKSSQNSKKLESQSSSLKMLTTDLRDAILKSA